MNLKFNFLKLLNSKLIIYFYLIDSIRQIYDFKLILLGPAEPVIKLYIHRRNVLSSLVILSDVKTKLIK